MRATAAGESMRGFIAHLRLNGYNLSAADIAAALGTLQILGVALTSASAKSILRTVLASDRGEWDRFGELFDVFWFGRGVRTVRPAAHSAVTRKLWNSVLLDNDTAAYAAGEEGESTEDGEHAPAQSRRNASKNSAPKKPDIGKMRQLPQKEQLLEIGERLAKMLCRRPSRRYKPARRGVGADIRRTLRRSISSGGEPLHLVRRARKSRMTRLSALLDVSGSMKEHYELFLFFVKGLLNAGVSVEAFIFHTRLVRVTSALSERSTAKALEKFALQTQGIGGGTRIAGCLNDFIRQYGRRCLGRSAVLIISDGYDSGEPEDLQKSAAALRCRTPRLFWLSPSLARADSPKSRSLTAAAGLLTALAPARSLTDLQSLEILWRGL